MFKLSRLNIERVVDSEHDRDNLIKQGYKLVGEQQTASKDVKKSVKK